MIIIIYIIYERIGTDDRPNVCRGLKKLCDVFKTLEDVHEYCLLECSVSTTIMYG